jgi:hypothetical protein
LESFLFWQNDDALEVFEMLTLLLLAGAGYLVFKSSKGSSASAATPATGAGAGAAGIFGPSSTPPVSSGGGGLPSGIVIVDYPSSTEPEIYIAKQGEVGSDAAKQQSLVGPLPVSVNPNPTSQEIAAGFGASFSPQGGISWPGWSMYSVGSGAFVTVRTDAIAFQSTGIKLGTIMRDPQGVLWQAVLYSDSGDERQGAILVRV